jgi:hypothetical protein
MDSLEECSLSSDASIASLSISCIDIFLRSLQSICNCNGLEPDIIERINQLYPNLEDAEFEGFDVRNNKIEMQSNACCDNQTVAFEVLKERIKGYDANDDMTDNCEEVVEDKPLPNDELSKNFKNFKIESFKSKLSEILKSRSTDSNTDSLETDDNIADEENKENKENINKTQTNDKENIDKSEDNLVKMESFSTDYEEVGEYQRSATNSTTSNTEGPEFEDCIDEELTINGLTDISRKQDDQQWIQEVCQNSTERVHRERDNSRLFFKALKRFLPTLLSFRSSVETDEALQLFASNYCKGYYDCYNYYYYYDLLLN